LAEDILTSPDGLCCIMLVVRVTYIISTINWFYYCSCSSSCCKFPQSRAPKKNRF